MSALFVSLLFLLVCLTLPPAAGGAKPKVGLRQDYRTLGVSPNSQTKEIKSAYRKLSLEFHPDRYPGCSDCGVKQANLNSAYERIRYARREHDNPELSKFFGFSEKIYNLVYDLIDLWESVPSEMKLRLFHLLEEYRQSPALVQDLEHLFTLIANLFVGPLASLIFYMWLFAVLCFWIGCFWILIRVFRLFKFLFGLVFSVLVFPFRLLSFGSSSKEKMKSEKMKSS